MKIALMLILLIGLIGCAVDDPETRSVCVAGHVESGTMILPDGNGGMTIIPTSDYVCDQRIIQTCQKFTTVDGHKKCEVYQ